MIPHDCPRAPDVLHWLSHDSPAHIQKILLLSGKEISELFFSWLKTESRKDAEKNLKQNKPKKTKKKTKKNEKKKTKNEKMFLEKTEN